MLTPQAIKDQDFQIKFRGYDSIEVKAYLELLAEDFFELTEQNRLQAEELESL
jgi:DivIVA domain-containing protein